MVMMITVIKTIMLRSKNNYDVLAVKIRMITIIIRTIFTIRIMMINDRIILKIQP